MPLSNKVKHANSDKCTDQAREQGWSWHYVGAAERQAVDRGVV